MNEELVSLLQLIGSDVETAVNKLKTKPKLDLGDVTDFHEVLMNNADKIEKLISQAVDQH